MRNFLKDKRGSIGMVIALIVTVVALVIGVYLLATFQASMPAMTGTANTTAYAIFGAGWSSLAIAVILPIIIVAGAIIGYLVRGFGGGGAR